MEMKPCPFCGSTNLIIKDSENGVDEKVWCISCQANIPRFKGRRTELIDAWNNRVKEDYNTVNINVGDKRFCVVNDYPNYIVKEGTCKKISKHNNNSTKYTFKMNNYKTYTFTESSFGKKVFNDLDSAENATKILNKE